MSRQSAEAGSRSGTYASAVSVVCPSRPGTRPRTGPAHASLAHGAGRDPEPPSHLAGSQPLGQQLGGASPPARQAGYPLGEIDLEGRLVRRAVAAARGQPVAPGRSRCGYRLVK